MSDTFDLAIIGGGAAGLVGAGFAARLGARVALVERHRLGGDCTWTGCVPSKALVKAARVAHQARRAAAYGIEVSPPRADMPRVRAYVHSTVERVYREEQPAALERRGITVVLGAPQFTDPRTIRVADRTITARRFVICTGSRPTVPPIPGLAELPFWTSETLFDNERLPAHLIVLGAGPIGLEMAQAYRRLGSRVTVLAEQFMPHEEFEVRFAVRAALEREGVRFVTATGTAAGREQGQLVLRAGEEELRGDALLVAAGRRPNVEGLGLEQAGVTFTPTGITTDRYLRTTGPDIYAAGDVLGGHRFTHVAAWQAFQAVRNALLPGRAVGIPDLVPWVTFVDPEAARVGVSEDEARERHGAGVRTHRWEMADAERAVCDGETGGFIKVVTRADGVVLGASIVASRAGEMIGELALAIRRRLTLSDLAATMHAYPTWATAVQQLASAAAVEGFLARTTGRLALWLSGLGRRA